MEEKQITRLTADNAGCIVEGNYGQYASARVVEYAASHGYVDDAGVALARRKLSMMGRRHTVGIAELTADELESLDWSVDAAEDWLNEHVAPAGYRFEWIDGEFFLSVIADEDMESEK